MQEAIKNWVEKVLNERVYTLEVIQEPKFLKKILKLLDPDAFITLPSNNFDDLLNLVSTYYTNQLKTDLKQYIVKVRKDKNIIGLWEVVLGLAIGSKRDNIFLNKLINLGQTNLGLLMPFIKRVQELMEANEIAYKKQYGSSELEKQLMDTIQQLTQKKSSLEIQIEELLEQIKNRDDQYDTDRLNLKTKIEQLENEKLEVLRQYEGVHGSNANMYQIFKSLEKQCKDLEIVIKRNVETINYYEAAMNELKQENIILKEDNYKLSSSEQLLRRYERKMKEYEEIISDLRSSQKSYMEKVYQLEENKINLKNSLRRATTYQRERPLVMSKKLMSENLTQIIEQAQEDKHENKTTSLKQQPTVNQSPINKLRQQVTPERPEIKRGTISRKLSLQKELKPFVNQQNNLIRAKEFQRKLEESTERLNLKDQQVEKLQLNLSQCELQIGNLKGKIESLQKLNKLYAEKIKELDENEVEKQEEYQEKFERLVNDLDHLKITYYQKENEINQLSEESENKSKMLQSEYDNKIEHIISSLETQLISFKNKELTYLQKIRKLTNQVTRLQNNEQVINSESNLLQQETKVEDTEEISLKLIQIESKVETFLIPEDGKGRIESTIFEPYTTAADNYAIQQTEQLRTQLQQLKVQRDKDQQQNSIVLQRYKENVDELLQQNTVLQLRNTQYEQQLRAQSQKMAEYIRRIIREFNEKYADAQLRQSKIKAIVLQQQQHKLSLALDNIKHLCSEIKSLREKQHTQSQQITRLYETDLENRNKAQFNHIRRLKQEWLSKARDLSQRIQEKQNCIKAKNQQLQIVYKKSQGQQNLISQLKEQCSNLQKEKWQKVDSLETQSNHRIAEIENLMGQFNQLILESQTKNEELIQHKIFNAESFEQFNNKIKSLVQEGLHQQSTNQNVSGYRQRQQQQDQSNMLSEQLSSLQVNSFDWKQNTVYPQTLLRRTIETTEAQYQHRISQLEQQVLLLKESRVKSAQDICQFQNKMIQNLKSMMEKIITYNSKQTTFEHNLKQIENNLSRLLNTQASKISSQSEELSKLRHQLNLIIKESQEKSILFKEVAQDKGISQKEQILAETIRNNEDIINKMIQSFEVEPVVDNSLDTRMKQLQLKIVQLIKQKEDLIKTCNDHEINLQALKCSYQSLQIEFNTYKIGDLEGSRQYNDLRIKFEEQRNQKLKRIESQLMAKDNQITLLNSKIHDLEFINSNSHPTFLLALKQTNQKLKHELKQQNVTFELFRRKYVEMRQQYINVKEQQQLLLSVIRDLRLSVK